MRWTFVSLVLLAGHVALAQGASFTGLGDLPGGSFHSEAHAVSADGQVIVGMSLAGDGAQAFRWTETSGLVELGDLDGGIVDSRAFAVSSDGSVIAGRSAGPNGNRAIRWTAAGGMADLGLIPGSACGTSEARAISSDGVVVAGFNVCDNGENRAFRWTQAGGMTALGDLAGGVTLSHAYGISADGLIIVGDSHGSSGREAFHWTETGGMVGLGDLPGDPFASYAYAVSADGTVIVGQGSRPFGDPAYRWTEAGGMIGILDLDGGTFISIAYATSADGSVIVGLGTTDSGPTAFLWNAADSIRSVKEILEVDHGLDLTGWSLQRATGVSADGRVIVGWGMNPAGVTEAWRAVLPGASSAEDHPDQRAVTLFPPMPNPASGAVAIRYRLARAAEVRLVVVDVMGREVLVLEEGPQPAGEHRAVLPAGALAPGVYLARLAGRGGLAAATFTVAR
jgi:probable HAF family extracellular repeat protein